MKRYYKLIDGEEVFFEGNVLTYGGAHIANPTEEQMLEAGWSVYQEPEPSDAEKLAAAKAEKLMQIEMYDSSANVEQFIVNGIPMWLGHELRQQIRTSADAYSAMGAETMTKVFEGMEFTFPITTWLEMLNALEVYAAEALNATERHKNNVSAMDNVEDVEDYNYTTGYPAKLEF
jgi:hypothetical protein